MGVTFARPVESGYGRGAGVPVREELDSIARASRIKKRKVMLREDWWKKDNGPLLAFKRGGPDYPLALIQLSPIEYAVFDPTRQTRRKVNREIAQSIEPVAYTFFRPLPEHKLNFWDLVRYSLKGSSQSVATVLLMGLLSALLGLIVPIATGIIFNTVIPNAEIGLLWQLALILTACAIGTVAFDITQSVAVLRLQGKTESALQAAVWDRLMSLRASFFRHYASGDLAIRGLGIGDLRHILSLASIKSLIAALFSLLNFLLLFHYSPFLAWICAAILLVSVVLMIPPMLIMLYKQIQVVDMDGKISGMLLQFVTGVSKLRVTGSEKRAFAVWAKDFSLKKTLSKHAHICQNILTTLHEVLPIFSLIIIFTVIVFKIMKTGAIPIGNYMAFIAAYTNVQLAMQQMSIAVSNWLYAVPVYKRMQPILSALPEYDSEKPPPGRLVGNIEVNHVSFRYQKDGPVIMDDVSLSARPGEFIAITGSSGAGKSTLLRLLLGFEIPDSGSIYYDGKDLSKFDLGEFRRQIGVVLQNGRMLQDSILENIVGSSGLGINEAWAAAELAGCKQDIEEMPMKMLTVVTSGGGTISGGQRQRIIIARALVRKPRIVFFDEATSSLDNATQDIVTKSLENLRATRIVIAHRLSTIRKADKIYVLDGGRIVQCGKYEELMKQEGVFALLAKRQII
jgi:ATP-binding cassette subfamily C protein